MEANLTIERDGQAVAQLVVHEGETLVLGRGPGAEAVLEDPALQPRHAAVTIRDGVARVVDLGGGSLLNDEPLAAHQPAQVWSGDELRLGAHLIRLRLLGRGRGGGAPPPANPLASFGDEFAQVREIGAGAMGRVFAAQWVPRGVPVAVKVLHAKTERGSPEFERFVREAQTVARLDCPYVVRVLDVRLEGAQVCSVMELVDGQSAWDAVQKGPLSIPDVLTVAEHVGRALFAAAEAGVVHRDVKPANILLSAQGVAKLCDFGIAKDLDSTLRSLTASGMGLGSMAYMAPEQIGDAKGVDPRADAYSLGATLYHLLTGRPPFSPTSMQDLVASLQRTPTPILELRPDCPSALARIVHGLLARDPDDRSPLWQIVDELAALRR